MVQRGLVESEAGKAPGDWLGNVLIFPGGGYHHLSPREAEPVARAFALAGWKPWILYYSIREMDRGEYLGGKVLKEAGEAMLEIRRRQPGKRIVVCGFSAGAHAAGNLGVHWQDIELPEKGADARLLRPDAMILSYPVISSGEYAHPGSFLQLIGEKPGVAFEEEEWTRLKEYFSLETQVGKDTPPCFLWHTAEDSTVPVENSLLFAAALSRAQIPFELRIFPYGEHGLSLATKEVEEGEKGRYPNPHVATWFSDCVEWLSVIGK